MPSEQHETAIKYGDDTFKVRLCNYCGSLDWTVREHGHVTHKEECPNRQEAYSQTYPKRTLADVVVAAERAGYERGQAEGKLDLTVDDVEGEVRHRLLTDPMFRAVFELGRRYEREGESVLDDALLDLETRGYERCKQDASEVIELERLA